MSFIKPNRLVDARTIYKEMRNQLNRAKLKLGNVEIIDFTPELRYNQRTIGLFTKFHNEINKIVNDPDVRLYQLPAEPDGNQLVLWYMCREYGSFGNQLRDDSGFNNHASVIGSGASKTAGHVDGLNAISVNGTTNYIRTPNHGLFNTNGGNGQSAMTALSIEFWIKPKSISLTTGNRPRIIAYKADIKSGNTITRGWSIWVEQDGTIWFSYRHSSSNTYAQSFSRAVNRLDDWYFGVCTLAGIGSTNTPKLYINGVASTAPVVTNRPPQFPTTGDSAGLDLFIAGTDEGTNIAKVSGNVGDFRIWRGKTLTAAEVTNQWSNKYTILDIENVARVNASYIAVEGVEGPGNPGEEPNPPPDPTLIFSFSSLAFMPESFTIDELNQAAPGGMGIAGGTGGADPTIPAQFMDSFNLPVDYYTLTSLNQVSPNSKWKLSALPGTGGFVRTESYTHAGESVPANILRMKHGTSSPIVVFNTAKFGEFFARFTFRTLARTSSGDLNAAHIMFKYVDANNYYYLVLRPSNIEVRKVIAGSDTVVGTGPTRSNNFAVGSIHTIEMWLKEDGGIIDVVADNDSAASRLTVGTHPTSVIPADSVASAVAPMAIRALNSDIEVDDILVRPLLSEGWESGSPWSLTTAASISPNGKWKLEVAQGSGGQCRTTTTGGGAGNYNNILDLRHGTASPVLISQTTFTNLLMEWQHKTNSQTTGGTTNRLWIIFKWLNASNYYYFVAHPSGWQIRRVLTGVDEVRVTSTANGLADADTFANGSYKLLVTNSGLDVELVKGATVLYKEEWGQIKTPAIGGGSSAEIISEDDNGLLAGAGKVGFKATNCDADVAYVTVSSS